MFRTVLLPVDFSDDNELILAFARGLPALGVRRVVLGHAVDVSGLEGPIIARKVDDARERIREFAGGLEAAGLGVEVRVAAGDPVDELGALATEAQVDAVVYGSHAKSLVGQLVAGSVSERLLRDATVPHLVARYDLLRRNGDPSTWLQHFGEKLVLATDFSLAASRAFNAVLALPKGAVKHLFLLHAIDPALTGDKLRRAEEGAEFQLRNIQAAATQNGVASSISLRVGSPIQTVLAEIDERRATGIVAGTRGRNAVQEMLLGSVSMTLLRQASCPVLVVP